MFEITREWAEGMIVEALVGRGVPEDEARNMSDLSPLLAERDAEVWDEGFTAGVNHDLGDWDSPPEPIKNPYREEQS